MTESQPQPNPAPWRSRLFNGHNNERQQRIQEGRARHRAETSQKETAPPQVQPTQGPDMPEDLVQAHQEWHHQIQDWEREAREANAKSEHPATVSGRQLNRETTRIHRLISDTIHHSFKGFNDALLNQPSQPPRREPQKTVYEKAYLSGYEAAQACAKRARQKRNRSNRNNQKDERSPQTQG